MVVNVVGVVVNVAKYFGNLGVDISAVCQYNNGVIAVVLTILTGY